MPPMNRRDALKTTTVLVGGVLFAASGVLSACARDARPAPSGVLAREDQDLMEEIADTLLPTTAASPGARAAGAGPAINLLLTDCYEPPAQQRALQGLKQFRAACHARYGSDFTALRPQDRTQFLRAVDADARKTGESHYFSPLRQLAYDAYFSSETGMTKALRYIRVPGRFVGCMPLAPGQPAWG